MSCRRRDFLRTALAATAAPLLPSTPLALSQDRQRYGPRDLEINFRWSPLLSLHNHLLKFARSGEEPPEHYADAVKLYAHHLELVPGTGYWLNMSSYIAPASDIAAVHGQLRTYPKQFGNVNLEPSAKAVGFALADTWPTFEQADWLAIQRVRREKVEPVLSGQLGAGRSRVLEFMFTSLNAEPVMFPRLTIDLVGRYIQTGSATARIHGTYFTIVETERFQGLDTLETVLMMVGRILELEDRGHAKGALFLLRERQAPLHLPNPALLPRAVLYWTAGEAVRRLVDPEHQHVGAKLQIYSRAFRPLLPALEEYWSPYLSGELGLDEALNGIIAAAR